MGRLLEMVVRRSKDFIKNRNIGASGVHAAHQALAPHLDADRRIVDRLKTSRLFLSLDHLIISLNSELPCISASRMSLGALLMYLLARSLE